MTILIVEDEPRASRGLKNLIESAGAQYEVVGEALDGREALEMMHTLEPDVVMTDIRMPVMDGMSLIRAARSQNRKSRFVIISAYEEFDIARQALSLGVEDYLVKPLMAEDVHSMLEKLEKRENGKNWGTDSKDLKSRYPNAHPLILKALRIIEESYASRVTQKDLAADLGVTAEYFSYLFAKSIGVNFARFLRQYRIEKAKQLLAEGTLPAEDVCYKTGFTDPKYFGKCFKEETGKSISDFLREQ